MLRFLRDYFEACREVRRYCESAPIGDGLDDTALQYFIQKTGPYYPRVSSE